MLTVGPVAENCFLFRREGSDRAADRRSRRGGRADPRRGRGERGDGRGDPRSPTATSTTSAPSRRWPRRPARRSTAPRSRCRSSPTSWPSSPGQGFGPFESYEADETVARRRDAGAGGAGARRRLHPRPQPRPRHLLGPRRGRDLLRRRPLPGLGRPGRPARRRRADPARSIRTLLDSHPDETDVYPGHMGTDHARRRARHQPLPRRAGPLGPGAAGKVARTWRASSRPRAGPSTSCPRQRRRARAGSSAPPRRSSRRAGYEPIATPAFEDTELFERGVGQSTDIVRKEMFTFEDKGGRSLTLRPGGHGADLPRLPRARDAETGAAGEALLRSARSSATSARRRAATASSTRSGPRRSAPTRRSPTPR